MIESIRIADIATYGSNPEVMDRLSQFNFIYGSNGSGKTTISRIIANEATYTSCHVQWKNGVRLQPMVYNLDFIENNFNLSSELKGVFTLGESQTNTIAKIASVKKEIDELAKKNSGLTETLQGADSISGKKGELKFLEEEFKTRVWELKQKYDSIFSAAFEGLRNNAEKFLTRFLQESSSNSASLFSLDDLQVKAQSIFSSAPVKENLVPTINGDALIRFENDPILLKPVIGKEDVDIAAMIKKLGNSDWVKSGKIYFEKNDHICPFCQQPTHESFAESLAEYFDETFLKNNQAIDTLYSGYTIESQRLQSTLQSLITNPSCFLDSAKFEKEYELFLSKVTINQQRLKDKKDEPSRVIILESLRVNLDSIVALIISANKQINNHNSIVANLANEKRQLIAQVWRYLLEETKSDLGSYKSKKTGLEKAIANLESQISNNNEEKQKKESEVRNLEKQTTSIQPTIDGINGLLKQFGFTSFNLSKSAAGNSYRLLRTNGMDAKTTLSEGEKTFVCFLYFYYLLKGSSSESGITTDRIIVFDDPVSSLDSDILFIVSSLIKGLFEEVRTNAGHIKQIFIMTHNVYFHKEISFNSKRNKNQAMREETFWIVGRDSVGSRIQGCDTNPIKTSYDLLWSEIRTSNNRNALTIQNTLRRILENYFKILGGVDPDGICSLFEGKEKMICKSLFSWVNDGSHFAQDDLYVSVDNNQIETYLTVFHQIFKKSENEAHYCMMMGDAYVALLPSADRGTS